MTKSYGHLEAVVWVSEAGDIGDASWILGTNILAYQIR